ncbi:DegV family protein [Mycoplasmoides pirum]|uniref:DegV family protein n=1 Tax=Mycoplasmoides pirum TaxID=2122 RepID=UPI00056B6D16|nr:DegV family protein [Mycoplasmoides pirum]
MSSKIAIITDTSSTILPDELSDVYVVSLLVTINDQKTYLDGRELTSKDLYNYFLNNSSGNVKTSLPRATDVIDTLNQVVDKYEHVIMLPISSGLSGTYNQWKMIVENEFASKNNIHIFDTQDTAISLRWLVVEVKKLAENGASIAEIQKYVEDWHSRISCVVILNDLTQARNGGRIGKVTSYIGGILRIKPILHFHNGKNTIISKKPTNKLAIMHSMDVFDKIFNFAKNKIEKVGFCNSFISLEKISKTLSDLKEILKKYNVTNIEEAPITPIIGAHTGNDAFSINILVKSFSK